MAIARGFDCKAAMAHIAALDPCFAPWFARLGALDVHRGWRKTFVPSDALARAILFQQLSGKAGATIAQRVEAAMGAPLFCAANLERIDDLRIRSCGVSQNKLLALRDLASKERAGLLPSVRQMAHRDDESLIEQLTAIRGIGRWTVQMMLMFRLGRPDVLPVDDLGVRKGLQVLDQSASLPSPRALAERGAIWQPYRSMAAFYLWRIADTANAKDAAATPRSQS